VQALHELQITETAVCLYEYVRQQPDIHILEEGCFMLQSERAFESLVPDYWCLTLDQNGLMFHLFEMIAGEESGTRIRGMFEEYAAWSARDEVQDFLIQLYRRWGAKEPTPESRINCILHSRDWNHTDSRKERLAWLQTLHVPPAIQGRVSTTTNDALSAAMDTGLGINHAIY